MERKFILAILILVVVILGVFLFNAFSQNPIKTAGIVNNPEEAEKNLPIMKSNVIEITSSGFMPSELTIPKGTKVTWVNKDAEEHWPASATHPTHKVYPGSDIEKCGTSEQEGIFDACHNLASGESWSFTFNEVGSWNYHDHLDLGFGFGKIIVE